jgi:hypothetical protein
VNIDDIRRKLRDGSYEISRHAQRRIVERNITEQEIREAAPAAEIIEDYPDDKYSPSCLILLVTVAQRPLHVQVCYAEPETLKLITVYEPDPVLWVDFRKRRQP